MRAHIKARMIRDGKMALQKGNLPVLERIVRRRCAATEERYIRVVEDKLLIKQKNSQGYNPYDNPGPTSPPESE